MNPQAAITLQYDPEGSERFPWLISAGQEFMYRVAEDTHATDTLKAIPQLIEDGWTPIEAIRRALQDSQTATFEQFEPV